MDATPRSRANLHSIKKTDDEVDSFVDPVTAAAAAGAAAKMIKDDRQRQLRRKQATSAQLPFRIEVDNEWKASLQRFARTAASTAKTMRSVAAPVFAEAAEAYHQVATTTQKQPKPAQHNNHEAELASRENPHDPQSIAPKLYSQIDQTITEAHPLGDKPSEQSLNEKVEGDQYQTPMQSQSAINPGEDATEPSVLSSPQDLEQGNHDLSKSFVSSIPVRRQQVAPMISTPAAFGGDYGSAYTSTPQSQSTTSYEEILQDSNGRYVDSGFGRRGKSNSATDASSLAASHTLDDVAWKQINFTERQQQLLATPKQFVDLISKKLSEERPKSGISRYRRRRRRESLFASTPTHIPPSWMRNGTPYAEGHLFDRLDERSPSLSPPGSPISAAMYLDSAEKKTPNVPVVTLWDMIPSKDDMHDSIPELMSERGGDTPVLPGPMLKQSLVFDPPPSEFMHESIPSDCEELLNDHVLDRVRKRKTDVDECLSVFSESLDSAGSLKRNRVDRRRISWRRRVATRGLGDKKADYRRTPPGITQKRELPPKRFSRSLSPDLDNSMRRQRLFELDASGLFAQADADCQSAQLSEDDGMLHEALLAFSTMTNLSLTNAFPKIELPDDLEYVASIRWRQLLANWKHREMIDVMTRGPPSLHFTDRTIYNGDPSVTWSSSASTTSVDNHIRRRETVRCHQVVLAPCSKNLSGLTPSYPFELQSLSRFITHVGVPFTDSFSTTASATEIKHVVPGEVTVEKLLYLAGEKHGKFSKLIDRLAVFASHDYNPSQMYGEGSLRNVAFSVDIKDALAIQRKAGAKYSGELLRVKDVLRAQVVFPTEGSLVCAFTFLNQYCSISTASDTGSEIIHEIGLKAEIARIKNLFAVDSSGKPCRVMLPTGYRHLLLNVRLDDSILVGKDD